jgi:hypothetical protein
MRLREELVGLPNQRQEKQLMRRTLIALVTGTALLAAVAPASADTSATGSSSVTADVASTLEATFPGAYAWGALDAGAAGNTSAAQVVNVKSNQTWGVKTSTDLANGRMKEWDGTGYVAASPKVLTNALQWRLSSLGGVSQATTFASYTGTDALVTGSKPSTDDSGTDVGVSYKQVISYADLSAGANDYRVQVNYNVSQGF